MGIETGLSWKVYVDTAEVADPVGGAPTWVELPNQTTGRLRGEMEDIDATHKGNVGWRNSITVERGLTIEAEGWSDPDDTAYRHTIDTTALGSTTNHDINVKMQNTDGDTYIFVGGVSGWDVEFDQKGLVTYSFTFVNRGTVTLARA